MYTHTQTGWVTIIALDGAIVAIGAANRMLGPGSPNRGFVIATMFLLALLIPLFGWLKVTVDSEAVTATFGIGLVRKRIMLDDIAGAARVRTRWYYGWGMRMGPNGWLYNVSGFDAVELTLKKGGTFTIGSDEPEQLLAAVRRRI
jgi:hypothetical protein